MDEVTAARCAHLAPVELRLAYTWLKMTPQDVQGPPVGVLVGEAPGKNTSPRLPMFPWPSSSAAGRLLSMSGLTAGEYLGRLWRRNLHETHALAKAAKIDQDRAAADAVDHWIIDRLQPGDSVRVLLLGARVGRAFSMTTPGHPSPLWARGQIDRRGVHLDYACVPHPSGLSRAYNDLKARLALQAAMQWVAGMV